MINKILYYLNKGNSCPPDRTNSLIKNNYLSEFKTDKDKELVRNNLGISDIIDNLKKEFDKGLISKQGLTWDLVPTRGNISSVVSSGSLYETLLNYTTKLDLDDNTLRIWTNTLNKITELYNKLECELNKLDEGLKNYTDELRKEFNEFVHERDIEIILLKERIRTLEIQFASFIGSLDGNSVTDQFGDNEYLGVNQKTITDAINRIWDKLGEITGNIYQGISMIVNPEYFIGDDGTHVHIQATTERANGIFEYLKLYINGNLLEDAENTNFFECDTLITDTSIITCEAKILGKLYTLTKTITKYDAYWIGAGNSIEDVMILNNIRSIEDKSMRADYDITFNEDGYLYIIFGDSLEDNFHRADMQGIEIPFTVEEITVEDKTYKVYKSDNIYVLGTYNIDING